jgi:exo-beta-1,3-glucanase (GH17 family)
MRRFSGFVVLLVIILGNIGGWWLLNRPRNGVPWEGQINSLSFFAFRRDDNPFENRYPTPESLAKDIDLVSGVVGAIRLYNSSEIEGNTLVPALAARKGLKVIASAQLRGAITDPSLNLDKPSGQMSGDEQKSFGTEMHFLMQNEEEIASVIRLANENPNIDRVIVGNEMIQTGLMTVPQLVRYIRRVKAAVRQPVSTAGDTRT